MITKYIVMASVILLMFAAGMGISFGQLVDAFKQLGIVLKGVLANFLIVPLFIYIILIALPLPPEIKIGIMLMAAAPVAPMAPAFVSSAKGDVAFAVGLMVVVAILSVVLTPLILGLTLPQTEEGLELDTSQIVQTLVIVQLIPIGIGMAIRHHNPGFVGTLLRFLPRTGQIRIAAMAIENDDILGSGFKSLAQIAANTLADPELDRPEFLEIRKHLIFRD